MNFNIKDSNAHPDITRFLTMGEKRKEANRGRGLPFIVNMAEHFAMISDETRDSLLNKLVEALPGFETSFLEQLVELLTGKDRNRHTFYENEAKILKIHRFK
ncbi:hypothetical protein SAMN05444678_12610 [Sphingomonas sp. YR710]|uniref:hypothetical protein n=1 Tax=Sphingomonas sp. YR710 TaxID=1882773 RepID=UPI0008910E42|nr:hypothetical protein [Sphingomonas sp. YR710]SDD84871.1 hypothetical protein SAMN05444678_12610 [Sphingomonas sp. YR710]